MILCDKKDKLSGKGYYAWYRKVGKHEMLVFTEKFFSNQLWPKVQTLWSRQTVSVIHELGHAVLGSACTDALGKYKRVQYSPEGKYYYYENGGPYPWGKDPLKPASGTTSTTTKHRFFSYVTHAATLAHFIGKFPWPPPKPK